MLGLGSQAQELGLLRFNFEGHHQRGSYMDSVLEEARWEAGETVYATPFLLPSLPSKYLLNNIYDKHCSKS